MDIWEVIEKARRSEEDMDRFIEYTSENDRLQMILDNTSIACIGNLYFYVGDYDKIDKLLNSMEKLN